MQVVTLMLTHVSQDEPTLDGFFEWMMRAFPTVRSRKTAAGYLDVPRVAGLVEPKGDRLTITAEGAAYLASGDTEDLFRAMASRIAGLEKSLYRLHEQPSTMAELTEFLNGLLGTSWKTDAQARWRAMWLESFGKVKRNGATWTVVQGTA